MTELSAGDAERMVSDMREALADPVFADAAPPLADLRLAASNADAGAGLPRTPPRYRRTHERLASLDEARWGARRHRRLPWKGAATSSPVRHFYRRRRPRRRTFQQQAPTRATDRAPAPPCRRAAATIRFADTDEVRRLDDRC
ncbi:MAG: hypothetical protein R3D46_14555 [Defluviimonas denitrificans]